MLSRYDVPFVASLSCRSQLIAGFSGILLVYISTLVRDRRQQTTGRFAQLNMYMALIMIAGYIILIHLYKKEAMIPRETLV